jgi:beta-lactamase regulating signal transducer with metallopeptidase domain
MTDDKSKPIPDISQLPDLNQIISNVVENSPGVRAEYAKAEQKRLEKRRFIITTILTVFGVFVAIVGIAYMIFCS